MSYFVAWQALCTQSFFILSLWSKHQIIIRKKISLSLFVSRRGNTHENCTVTRSSENNSILTIYRRHDTLSIGHTHFAGETRRECHMWLDLKSTARRRPEQHRKTDENAAVMTPISTLIARSRVVFGVRKVVVAAVDFLWAHDSIPPPHANVSDVSHYCRYQCPNDRVNKTTAFR